ncbi:hypothetical protein E3N88_26050 [Mikania micrantha]|uniref:Reverse transcriptase domain-containing protein n=1 Tax=Mikania micrantha TaxID=192012 RepID=A0A5N6N986_9ASTR|nr:hypothetical protein E3N88_26050 [Mikania micrantha]
MRRGCEILKNKHPQKLFLQGFGPPLLQKRFADVVHRPQKHLHKKYINFLAHVVEKKDKGKSVQDIPIIRDYPEVFLDDLQGIPPVRQVEFRIDLVPGANPIAKSPYRLAPSKLQEFASQIQELSDKGFIHPSHAP